ncbi:unnamed protein product, partial [Effrenium voratum]
WDEGWLLPTAKRCGCDEFTAPWQRGMDQLFQLADEDNDSALSFQELRQLADNTGEQISDDKLRLAMTMADSTDRGLTKKGLQETYQQDTGAVLYQDLMIYGLPLEHDLSLWSVLLAGALGLLALQQA